MLNKIKNRKQEGFTIIEVLIVLAIAGLILLIVFLAVPALQRNSRNTQRKNDVSALLGAVNEFVTNNNGTLPNTATWAAPTLSLTCTGGSCPAGTTKSEAKLGYYNKGVGTGVGQVQVLTAFAVTGPFTSAANDRLVVVPTASCGTNGASQAGSTRAVAAVHELETGASTYGAACQE